MHCAIHPEASAAGVCTRCGKFHCASCLVEVQGKYMCRTCVSLAFAEQEKKQSAAAPVPIVINNHNNNTNTNTNTNNVSASAAAAAAAGGGATAFAGASQTPPPVRPAGGTKSPFQAALLSLFIPGLGQIYCGNLKRGLAFMAGSILGIPLGFGALIWIWNVVDAYQMAKRYPQP